METPPRVEPSEISRFVGVYDADGSLRGELTYWIGARLGRRHCSLCEITHGSVLERKDWRQCRDDLGITFDTVHRDEASPEVMAVIQDNLPAVVALTSRGVVLLLGPEGLTRCKGSPTEMVNTLREAVSRHQLVVSSWALHGNE